MSRRGVVIASVMAVAMIAGAVYATFWILEQPVPPTSEGPATTMGVDTEPTPVVSEEEPEPVTGTIRVKLYVLAGSGETLATEEQEIPLDASLQQQAKRVIELLLRRSAAMPPGVELREVFITSQGVAYVDFSRELVQNHPGGSSAEELTVFSLSNTLIANFPAVKMVKILVEGREIQSIAGHLDLTIPYGRAPDYLQPPSERPESRNEAS